jgi:cyclophilin family peptidyl-prolyl cis-trans isomerase
VRGPAGAYLTIILYADFQCPACAQFASLLTQIQRKHPDDIRVVYRNFPLLTINDKASLSTQAAEAANLQGKFWEMHDLLFSKQAEWATFNAAKFQSWVSDQAAGLGLDQSKFNADFNSPEMIAIPQKAWNDGMKISLPGVPFILVNGEILKWQPTLLNSLETIIKLNLLPKKQFAGCPPVVIDPSKQYFATLKTAKGDIVIRLFADKTPNTVNNFVFLARQGWYDNTTFHRVVPGFAAQAGDPSGTGQGNPGYFVPDEIISELKYDRPGRVGMFSSGSGTNGSQFFITYTSSAKLNGLYTLFGEVTQGIDVLNQLTPRDALIGETLPDGDALFTVVIEEK